MPQHVQASIAKKIVKLFFLLTVGISLAYQHLRQQLTNKNNNLTTEDDTLNHNLSSLDEDVLSHSSAMLAELTTTLDSLVDYRKETSDFNERANVPELLSVPSASRNYFFASAQVLDKKYDNKAVNLPNKDGFTPLLQEIIANKADLTTVEKLLTEGADPSLSLNKKGSSMWHGYNALHIAIYHGRLEIVDAILACKHENLPKAVNAIIDRTLAADNGLYPSSTPLLLALMRKQANIAVRLAQAGADPSAFKNKQSTQNPGEWYGYNALHIAAYYGYPQVIDALIQFNHPNLLMANSMRVDRTGVGKGEYFDKTPAEIAEDRGFATIAEMLDSKRSELIAARSKYGLPLKVYLSKNQVDFNAPINEEALEHFLNSVEDKHRAEKIIRIYRMHKEHFSKNLAQCQNKNALGQPLYTTYLNLCIETGNIKLVEYALKKGADLTLTNCVGMGALHTAMQEGNAEIVNLLIKAGAFLNQTDVDSLTPLHKAACGNEHFIYFDKVYGTKPNAKLPSLKERIKCTVLALLAGADVRLKGENRHPSGKYKGTFLQVGQYFQGKDYLEGVIPYLDEKRNGMSAEEAAEAYAIDLNAERVKQKKAQLDKELEKLNYSQANSNSTVSNNLTHLVDVAYREAAVAKTGFAFMALAMTMGCIFGFRSRFCQIPLMAAGVCLYAFGLYRSEALSNATVWTITKFGESAKHVSEHAGDAIINVADAVKQGIKDEKFKPEATVTADVNANFCCIL